MRLVELENFLDVTTLCFREEETSRATRTGTSCKIEGATSQVQSWSIIATKRRRNRCLKIDATRVREYVL